MSASNSSPLFFPVFGRGGGVLSGSYVQPFMWLWLSDCWTTENHIVFKREWSGCKYLVLSSSRFQLSDMVHVILCIFLSHMSRFQTGTLENVAQLHLNFAFHLLKADRFSGQRHSQNHKNHQKVLDRACRRQEAGGRRQEAGGRRQEAGHSIRIPLGRSHAFVYSTSTPALVCITKSLWISLTSSLAFSTCMAPRFHLEILVSFVFYHFHVC